ncbi:D-aminoacyl-tRNA deacylase [Balneatrix alpica]|uniref:D-aminoacyl-tRNA deacylase n=1 Tax=Balneatrix alpica TaxID=75684 RepID=A0ABV5ZAD0_9GAMM|nr:D-aminoacyl-tRNA deacylase [Balneatrix alpica]
MKALIQRVKSARVEVEGEVVGAIDQGLLVLLGVERDDTPASADKLLEKILKYRVFSDADGKMNLSLLDIQGQLLLVSQFTLVADTRKGLRPSFSSGANPELGQELYQYTIKQAKKTGLKVEQGRFAADMQVHLINDGPVTFWLESNPGT